MLDVYRNYYGLTGEPFRLGPDHRFSLHHESYANAKAYLEYAIFQGEGFIAITGAPGTGKTTLISEILSELDNKKVQVATLTSTQLESRDMLQMVASSFDLHPKDASKASLLVEIESFLVRKIREGQRAILIVDEAQGLSKGALEELRLLANLQYQYQLLLQIFLVGQEQLLELISVPEMEHLHQRLVAATTLEALTFDETIDYIEHRLSRVGWKGDPSVDEDALREIYRYSGGIPRRINLIANRLFLQGGLEQKHSFTADDTRDVIKGLVEEFLLSHEPPISEEEMIKATAPGENGRTRSLPRDNPENPGATQPPDDQHQEPETESEPASAPDQTADTGATENNNEPIPFPGSRQTESSQKRGEAGSRVSPVNPEPAPGTAARRRPPNMERPVPPRSTSGALTRLLRKGDIKTIALVAIALVGAVYLLREPENEEFKPETTDSQVAEVVTSLQPEPAARTVESEARETSAGPVEDVLLTDGPVPADSPEPAQPGADTDTVTGQTKTSEDTPEKAAVDKPPSEILPGVIRKPAESIATTKVPAQPVVRQTPAAPPKVPEVADKPDTSSKPPPTVQRRTDPDTSDPDPSSIQARLVQLKQEAGQRLAVRRQQETEKPVPVPKPAAPVIKTPSTTRVPAPVPVKKKQQLTPEESIAALLEGSWSSSGKPASLLPSDTTFCNRTGSVISCKSVPQNVKTQYGLALYKVETVLNGFSPQGHFEMSYRTLVKLAGSGTGERISAASDNEGWQVSSYSMSCKLTNVRQVSCVDGKGIVREYQKTGPARQ